MCLIFVMTKVSILKFLFIPRVVIIKPVLHIVLQLLFNCVKCLM